MGDSGIQFFNRYTGEVETEIVYGEKWLRFILFNPFGKLALHMVAKRAWFSQWYGGRMSHPRSAAKGAAVHRAIQNRRGRAREGGG